MKQLAVIILAAGRGKRMKSDLPKVLHRLNGTPMLSFVINLSEAVSAEKIIVIAGHKHEEVIAAFKDKNISFALQKEQLGTAHAVAQAEPLFKDFEGDILILSGDVPLLKKDSILAFLKSHRAEGGKISIVTSHLENPHGYGRITRDKNGIITGIREEKDLIDAERGITEINAGIYAVDKQFLFETIPHIKNNNAQSEYYLPDIVNIASKEKIYINAFPIDDPNEILGINTPSELLAAEYILQKGENIRDHTKTLRRKEEP